MHATNALSVGGWRRVPATSRAAGGAPPPFGASLLRGCGEGTEDEGDRVVSAEASHARPMPALAARDRRLDTQVKSGDGTMAGLFELAQGEQDETLAVGAVVEPRGDE